MEAVSSCLERTILRQCSHWYRSLVAAGHDWSPYGPERRPVASTRLNVGILVSFLVIAIKYSAERNSQKKSFI